MYIYIYIFIFKYAYMHIDQIRFPEGIHQKQHHQPWITWRLVFLSSFCPGHRVHQVQTFIGSWRMHSSNCTKTGGAGYQCEEDKTHKTRSTGRSIVLFPYQWLFRCVRSYTTSVRVSYHIIAGIIYRSMIFFSHDVPMDIPINWMVSSA